MASATVQADARHWNSHLGFDRKRAKLYIVSVVGDKRNDMARTKFYLPFAHCTRSFTRISSGIRP